MGHTREQSHQILSFIEMNVRGHPRDITSITSEKFGITRQAVLRHVRKLIEAGRLSVHGKTRDRYYELIPFAEETFKLNLTSGLEEDKIWRENLLPSLRSVANNVREICEYGFTEIANNAIDHSDGKTLSIRLKFTLDLIDLWIIDDGVGIFQKIRESLNLEDNLHAILELSKGKLTTDRNVIPAKASFSPRAHSTNFQLLLAISIFPTQKQAGIGWSKNGKKSSRGRPCACKSAHNLPGGWRRYSTATPPGRISDFPGRRFRWRWPDMGTRVWSPGRKPGAC